jgi:hypothetical protein
MSSQINNARSGSGFLACFVIVMFAGCTNEPHSHLAPSVSTEKHVYAPGEDIQINFSNAPGNQFDWIAIYDDGVKPGSGIFTKLFLFTDGTNPGGTSGITKGTLMFGSASDNPESTTVDWPLAAGDYDVYLLCCDDYGLLAGPAEFTISSP